MKGLADSRIKVFSKHPECLDAQISYIRAAMLTMDSLHQKQWTLCTRRRTERGFSQSSFPPDSWSQSPVPAAGKRVNNQTHSDGLYLWLLLTCVTIALSNILILVVSSNQIKRLQGLYKGTILQYMPRAQYLVSLFETSFFGIKTVQGQQENNIGCRLDSSARCQHF